MTLKIFAGRNGPTKLYSWVEMKKVRPCEQKAVWRSVFLNTYHCIMNTDSTKTHSSSANFGNEHSNWRVYYLIYSRIPITRTTTGPRENCSSHRVLFKRNLKSSYWKFHLGTDYNKYAGETCGYPWSSKFDFQPQSRGYPSRLPFIHSSISAAEG